MSTTRTFRVAAALCVVFCHACRKETPRGTEAIPAKSGQVSAPTPAPAQPLPAAAHPGLVEVLAQPSPGSQPVTGSGAATPGSPLPQAAPAASPDLAREILKQAVDVEAEAGRAVGPDRLRWWARAMALYAAAAKADPAAPGAKEAMERIRQLPEVTVRRSDLEGEILSSVLHGESARAAALVDELRGLDPDAADLALLATGGGFSASPAEKGAPAEGEGK